MWQVVQDVRLTVHQAVEPLETHITKMRESYHEKKETWAGGHHKKKTVTKENTYSVNDEAGSSGGPGILKETETEETVESDDESDISPQTRVTITTEVSYMPESDSENSGDDTVFVKSTGCRRR